MFIANDFLNDSCNKMSKNLTVSLLVKKNEI